MAPAEDVDGNEKSTFRWLEAARYTVAFVVTVLIITVIAYAIVVVLRPARLTLSVIGGLVSAERSNSTTAPEVLFRFTAVAANPSGRVRIYYTNIAGLLSGKINASSPTVDPIILFQIKDLSVEQQSTVDSHVQVHGDNVSSMSLPYQKPYFDMFYYKNSSVIHDVKLKLNGTITVERYSGYNGNYTAGRPVVYYCWPLTIIGGDSSEETAADVQCTEDPPAS